jgi:hypothetical protein
VVIYFLAMRCSLGSTPISLGRSYLSSNSSIRLFATDVSRNLLAVHVNVKVKEGREEAFKQASINNARQSVTEPGIARFDVIQVRI